MLCCSDKCKKNNHEQYFKLVIIAILHHKEIAKNSQWISKEQHYKDWFEWFEKAFRHIAFI